MSERDVPVAVVVVTYNRFTQLRILCEKLRESRSIEGDAFFIVENASTDGQTLPYLQGVARTDTRFRILPQSENCGGSGGFYAGMKAAYDAGFEWIWVMDDDVAPLPGALDTMWKYTGVAQSIQVTRNDVDGAPIQLYGNINRRTLRRLLIDRATAFKDKSYVKCDLACFEGAFINRAVIAAVGLPEKDFFITWDDIEYGMRLSERFTNIFIKDACLQRTMDKTRTALGGQIKLVASVFSRYFFFRNFAMVIRKYRAEGKASRLAWITYWREFAASVIATLFIERKPRDLRILLRAPLHGLRRDLAARRTLFPG